MAVAVEVVVVWREVEGVQEGSECDGVDGEAWQRWRWWWSAWRRDGKVEEQERFLPPSSPRSLTQLSASRHLNFAILQSNFNCCHPNFPFFKIHASFHS